jgi:ATP-binding cassette subfamily B protein
MKRLLPYFKPYVPLFIISIILALVINASVIAKPYIVKVVIDDYLVAGVHDLAAFRLFGLLFFAVVLIGAVIGYLQNYILTYAGQKIMFDIRNQLFENVQRMNMSYFDKNSSGRILTRITHDVESLNELFSGMLVNIFRDTVMIGGIVAAMALMDLRLTITALLSLPLIALVTILYHKAARENFMNMKSLIGRINGFLAENITGMRVVQIFHREKEKFEEFIKLDKEYFSSSLREVILNSLCRPIVDVINNLTIAALIWFSIADINQAGIEIGVLFAFITYVRQFFQPISDIAERYTGMQSAFVSADRVFQIIDNTEQREQLNSGRILKETRGEIEFKDVWFAYEKDNWVLKGVNFKILPGEVVAFVGETGAGKSTIVGLISRFYEIQSGEILLDGIDIREYKLSDLRTQVAVVLQDVFLFSGNIKSNIRLKNSNISDSDIKQASERIGAAHFIESLPNGFDEEVKERGSTLSAGQRQLVSFARAIAFNPAVLVLDEPTSNIDAESERMIQEGILKLSRGRTCIIVAHRLSTIRNADNIIVIHDGNIIETGRHEELMTQNGLYVQLNYQTRKTGT